MIIFGYLNFKNYGDEILYREVIKLYPDHSFDKLSKKNSLKEHLDILSRNKELVAIGGLFQDKSSFFSCFYYAAVILIAKFMKIKIIMKANGIGPLKNPISLFLTYIAYKTADEVSVRDNYSAEFLLKWKIPHSVEKDLVYNIKEMKAVDLDLEESVFVIPRGFMALEEEKTTFIVFSPEDRKHAENLLWDDEKILDANDFEPEELIYLMHKYASSVVSMRYHGLVLADIAGVHYEPYGDDPKIVNFH
ncbi:MAG: polysaccharide pyruvyl transferase family protein [Candidatus Caenarcaniphilales bacterium]|jgi:hypothetical protein|nr:polysaccharide pyruvyl transferase family protein [Candidatus Caenarcaniphilales bacterium]